MRSGPDSDSGGTLERGQDWVAGRRAKHQLFCEDLIEEEEPEPQGGMADTRLLSADQKSDRKGCQNIRIARL